MPPFLRPRLPSLTLRSRFYKYQPEAPEDKSLIEGDKKQTTEKQLINLPRNISLMGKLYDEGTLCLLGQKLEEKLSVYQQRPKMEL